MKEQNEKMKFMEYMKPVLNGGRYTVRVAQKVEEPAEQHFEETEEFYVASRAYTLEADTVFSVSPAENECGDFSGLIPFITLKNETLPWEYRIREDIGGKPVPWVALIVISSGEGAEESDLTVGELLGTRPSNIYFPDKSLLPGLTIEKDDDLCHVVDLPKELYDSIIPSFEEMILLTHARRVDLADTEDRVAALDGDFSVIMANRFIPTGKEEMQKSTVHLVSMMGMTEKIPESCDIVRLVSLHRFNVFSVHDNSETFAGLIEGLSRNTGIIGYDRTNEVLKRCYVPKRHSTRTGETTYSLYRSPLIPYENRRIDTDSAHTADGRLIYDSERGIFDVSYAAAFQMGRLIALKRKADSGLMAAFRKKMKLGVHKQMLAQSMEPVNIYEAVKNMIEDK